MRKCNDECYPLCDFCKHYNFNGDENGAYTENGFCTFHNQKKDPSDFCEDFYCFNIKERKND